FNFNDGTLTVNGSSGAFMPGTLSYTLDGIRETPAAMSANATLVLTGGATGNFDDFIVGDSEQGTLYVSGGSQLSNATGYIANSAGTGSVTVSGSGSQWNNSSHLYVGFIGTGTLNVESGGVVSSAAGYINGTAGVATVTGSGSQWNNSEDLYVGFDDSGMLNVEDGGVVSSRNGYLSFAPNMMGVTTGIATVTGSGSQWNNSSELYVGNDGTGTLNIEAGGVVSNTNGYIGTNSGAAGTATVTGSGSQWNQTGSLYIGGSDSGDGGDGSLTISDGGLVDVTGSTKLWNTGTLTLDGGSLTTGTLDNTEMMATFNFNSGTLQITDSSQALTIGASHFALTNGTTFNTDAGTTTLGTDEHLNIAGAATIDSGATLTLAGGSLTSGSFTNNGTIHTASGTSNISGDMQLNGTMQVDTGSQLVLTGEVTGAGTFAGGGEVTFQGNLRPGNSPGTIEFGGDVTLDATSTTFIEIAGLTDSEFDRLVLSGSDPTLTIASGAQVDVQLINGFSLGLNQEFIFADVAGSNAVAGTFSGLGEGDLVGNFGGFDLFISYNAGTGNDISFFTSVPEPGALVMFGLVVGLGGMGRRRRRTA
ncbi:MAG: PEP-CTERM sorting domain-containing protein, partial [Pirellulaceae bacterium]|nr:PEP-CTERM sorting domain-containing protein [Pirellulaceae bacterium]